MATKLDQVIELDPPTELVFEGPFNDIVACKLTLKNPTTERICFKVKTTAPRRYVVRPNSGIIEPKSSVYVMLMLQPFEFDPNEKNKHKFMVQTLYAPEGDVNLDTLFKEAAPEQLMDSKLRCVFEMPSSSLQTSAVAPTTDSAPSQQPTSETAPRTPPKVSGLASKANSTDEVKKATEELKSLRSENSQLRQEVLSYKEEVMRLRTDNNARLHVKPTIANPMLDLDSDSQFTKQHFIYALVIAFFSFIVGKFIF